MDISRSINTQSVAQIRSGSWGDTLGVFSSKKMMGGLMGTPTLFFSDSTFRDQILQTQSRGYPSYITNLSDRPKKKKVLNVREHVKRVIIPIKNHPTKKMGGHVLLSPVPPPTPPPPICAHVHNQTDIHL